jgi:hypothetical protein
VPAISCIWFDSAVRSSYHYLVYNVQKMLTGALILANIVATHIAEPFPRRLLPSGNMQRACQYV